MRGYLRMLIPLSALLMLSACDSQEVASDRRTSVTADRSAEQEMPGEVQAILDAQSDSWPDYIPDDIPALPDNIRKVMEGADRISIRYHQLSQERIDEYLELLGENGFHLEFVVYQDERYPDEEAAKRRIEEGDFDAVHITKGDYRLKITCGGGYTVLDIEASGWEDANPFTPLREWPADLADVPMPQDCRIEAVYPQDAGGHQIVCRPEDEDAVERYFQALQTAGYLPVDAPRVAWPPVGSDYPEVLGRDDMEITLDYSVSVSTFRLTVWRLVSVTSPGQPTTAPSPTVDTPGWPEELAGVIPQPAGAMVDNVLNVSGISIIINCHSQGDGLLTAYAGLLKAEGFREKSLLKTQSGEVKQITLVREPFTVDLMPPSGDSLVIRVTQDPPGAD
ncbi:MAG: hypothetical protein JXA87_06620 [Thermoleophilia bacterium]|nr:hypothetical protein [Thermoleophilia bacterium]